MTLTPVALAPALAGRQPPSAEPAALRVLADRLNAAAQRYELAGQRLSREASALGPHWRGTGSAAGMSRVEQLQARARDAAAVHDEAASVLLTCAHRLDDAQAAWQRAESLERQDQAERAARAAAAGRGEFVSPYDVDGSALRRQARHLADQAHLEADAAAARAAAQLQELAEHAPRRDNTSRRPLTPHEQLAGVGRGAFDAVWGSITTIAGLSMPRLLLDRDGWHEQVREMRDGATYAAGHPREAGKAAVGWDLLEEGRYGEWVGGLVPDLVGGVFTGGALPAGRRAAELGDELADLAEDVDDLQRVHGRGADANAGGPVTRRPDADLPDDYVDVVLDLTPERRRHILDGDPPEVNGGRGGGHRHGTGKPNKTEFPAHWSDDDIIRRVMETARAPQAGFLHRQYGNFNVTAKHDGMTVLVSVNRRGEVLTAYPLAGGRGVVRNS